MNLNASEKKSQNVSSKIILNEGNIQPIEPGLILPEPRRTTDKNGNVVFVFTKEEYKLNLKIFNNYATGVLNTKALMTLELNYNLHLDLKDKLIEEKTKQVEAYKSQSEFNKKIYQEYKDKLRSQERKNKFKLIFGVTGGIGVGILIGFLLGAVSS